MIKLKRRIGSAFLACMMLLSLLPVTALAGNEPGSITIQGKDGTYSTIAEAVREAKDNDIINIPNGTYKETVTITGKSLTLRGESEEGTIIKFDYEKRNTNATYNGSNCYPIVSSDSNLVIKNLTISGPTSQHHGIGGVLATADLTMDHVTVSDIRCTADSGYVCGVQYGRGIMVEGNGNVSITNCTVKDFQKHAIDLNTSGTVTVDNNVIQGVGAQQIIAQNGIVIRKGDATITNNKISALSYTADNEWQYGSVGIYPLSGVTSLTITGNTLDAVDEAMYTEEVTSCTPTIENNTVTNPSLAFSIEGEGSYPTLANALENATAGATIKVAAGTYQVSQNITIDKDVTIVGEGKDVATLVAYAEQKDQNGGRILIKDGANVAFKNLKLTASYAADIVAPIISVCDTAKLTLTNCAITDTSNGYSSGYGLICTGNATEGSKITMTGCTVDSVKGNNSAVTYYVLGMGGTSELDIQDNVFNLGSWFMFNMNAKGIVRNNQFNGVDGASGRAINSMNLNGLTIEDNVFDETLKNTRFVIGGDYTITGNTFESLGNSTAIAIYDKPDSVAEISNNTFALDDDSIGIYVTADYGGEAGDLKGLHITGNTFTGAGVYFKNNGWTGTADLSDNQVNATVATGEQLKTAVENAVGNTTIVLEPGTYDKDITIRNSITIQGANAGVNPNTETRGAESIITGKVTIDKQDIDVVLDGLKFTGNGSVSILNNGTYEYSKDTTLTMRNCVAESITGTFVSTPGNAQYKLGEITIENNRVIGVGTEGGSQSAFNLWGVVGHKITGNYVEDVAFNAFNLDATYGDVLFENNTIKNVGANGFQIANSAEDDATVEILDNTFDGVKQNAIYLCAASTPDAKFASNFVIAGNKITNSGDAIVLDDVIITGNLTAFDNTKDGNLISVEGTDLVTATVKDRDQIVQVCTVKKGSEVTLPAAPSRAGYSFRGWYDGHNLYAAGEAVQITKDTTFVAQWSDNTPYYTITVKDAENGTVTCYAKSAAKGADVTLNVKADVGYQLDKLTVTDASGNVIDVEKVNNTTYTFVMPGSKVTVEAIFAPTSVEPSDLPFTDVSTSDWFYGAVKFVYENGLMDGVGNNLFAPNATLNRAMAVTILYRLEGSPAVTTDAGFNDVAAGTWYTDAVNWAAANNIVNGVEGNNFDPTGSLTREQMATVLYRYAQYKGADVSASGDLSGFVDSANVSSWAADAVKWAVGSGLVNGVEGNALAPQGTSTRAQAATVLMRFVG